MSDKCTSLFFQFMNMFEHDQQNKSWSPFKAWLKWLEFEPASGLRRAISREAARKRRQVESDIFGDLSRLLPLQPSVRAHLDKPSVIRLTLSYIRTHALFRGSSSRHACSRRHTLSATECNEIHLLKYSLYKFEVILLEYFYFLLFVYSHYMVENIVLLLHYSYLSSVTSYFADFRRHRDPK